MATPLPAAPTADTRHALVPTPRFRDRRRPLVSTPAHSRWVRSCLHPSLHARAACIREILGSRRPCRIRPVHRCVSGGPPTRLSTLTHCRPLGSSETRPVHPNAHFIPVSCRVTPYRERLLQCQVARARQLVVRFSAGPESAPHLAHETATIEWALTGAGHPRATPLRFTPLCAGERIAWFVTPPHHPGSDSVPILIPSFPFSSSSFSSFPRSPLLFLSPFPSHPLSSPFSLLPLPPLSVSLSSLLFIRQRTNYERAVDPL